MAYGQNMNAPMSGLMGLAAMKGRMGDNTLVHVNPMELKALNAMAGPGGLTQNPSTGLPEAFKIKDILPILGGIAGAALLGPAAAAALGKIGITSAGAATGVATGIGTTGGALLKGDSLEEAAMQGLGSGLTAGIMTPGGGGGVGQKAASQLPESIATELGEEGLKKYGEEALKYGAQNITGIGLKETSRAGLGEIAKFGLQQAGLKGIAGGAAGAALSNPAMYEMPKEPTYTPPSTVPYTERTQTASKEDIDRYIRQGGATPQFFNYSPTQIPVQFGGMAKEGGSMGDVPATYMAQGSNEGMFSGMVKAPEGDGMSDNVAFKVVGDPEIKQAMLSPDEYVIDAQTVSLLGNGSSDAGAKELDEFRRLVREKGTGREAQQNQINAAKELRRLT